MELSIVAARSGKLLSFLRRELGLSATLVKRLKTENALLVDGAPVFTDYPVCPGSRISVCLDETPPDFPAEDGPLALLYEDDGLIALDKPPGLLMHPTAARYTGTLANRLLAYFRATGQHCGIHPVSRLDRDTFGVVLLAKNAHMHALCAAAQGVEKCYCAAVWGGPPADAGRIDLPLGRQSADSLWRTVRPDGQAAVTDYQVLRRGPDGCLLALRPVTGRTHQLRAHCLAAGFPILGDPVYASPASAARSAQLGLAHQQLLAQVLTFSHPLTGHPVQIRSQQTLWTP